MMFWIAAAGITAGAVALIATPLLKAARPIARRGDYDLEVYRDQLAELERDVQRGLISPQQAGSAKAEIGRRMLAIDAAAGDAPPSAPPPSKRSRLLALAVAGLIPVGALAIYLPLGAPDLPARPLAQRDLDRERNRPPASVLAAIDKLKADLAAKPDNLDGWTLLARTMARMGEWEEASAAFRNILRLSPDDLDARAAYAEALINLAKGKIGADALALLREVQAKLPDDPRARFYLALARQQQGDDKGALAEWRALVAATPADAPWLPMVQARIEETASKLGLDIATIMPQPAPAAQPTPPAPPAGQAAADGGAAERQQMIDGMVKRLEEKLAANPADVDGWARLARSYRVMGDVVKAEYAGRQAVAHGPQRADAYLALADALMAGLAQDAPLPEPAAAALRQALALEPANRDALWMLGVDAALSGRKAEAAALWGQLLAQFEAGSPDHAFVKQRLDGLK